MDEFKNENEEKDENDSTSFLEFLHILSELNENKKNRDEEMHNNNMNIAKLQKSMFDSYVAVGFSDNQALDLTKNMINAMIGGLGPIGDK